MKFIWKEKVTRCDTPPDGDVTLTSGATLAVNDVLVAAGHEFASLYDQGPIVA